MSTEDSFYRWLFEEGHMLIRIGSIYAALFAIFLIGGAWVDISEWIKRKLR